jgi:hypothetical protein
MAAGSREDVSLPLYLSLKLVEELQKFVGDRLTNNFAIDGFQLLADQLLSRVVQLDHYPVIAINTRPSVGRIPGAISARHLIILPIGVHIVSPLTALRDSLHPHSEALNCFNAQAKKKFHLSWEPFSEDCVHQLLNGVNVGLQGPK